MENSEKEKEDQNGDKETAVKQCRFYKRMTIFLTAVCLLMAAAGTAGAMLFFTYHQQMVNEKAVEAAVFEEKLENAQEQIEVLEAQKEELDASIQENMIALVDDNGTTYLAEKIPFFVNPDDWRYILVNEINPLEEGFEVELERFSAGQYVDARIKDSLDAMFAAAKDAGLNLMVCSSYREIKKQDQLMDSAIKRYMRRGMSYTEAFYEAKEQIALTGTSEHHTGLAVDIVGVNHQSLDAAQAETKEAVWLEEHAAEYGFILRFPEDKEKITGIAFESWHFRYVGEEAASYMKEKNLCLEEFVALAELQLGLGIEDRININMRDDH